MILKHNIREKAIKISTNIKPIIWCKNLKKIFLFSFQISYHVSPQSQQILHLQCLATSWNIGKGDTYYCQLFITTYIYCEVNTLKSHLSHLHKNFIIWSSSLFLFFHHSYTNRLLWILMDARGPAVSNIASA